MKRLIITILMIFTILLTGAAQNTNKAYAQGINTSNKHSITETITFVTNSIYNPLNNQYINYCVDENDEVYTFYSDKNLFRSWQVLIIDTKATPELSDDEVINSFNLDGYTFQAS